jgi:type I restriction enzyme M protein
MSDVVNKLWGFRHTLRHDGIDYGDYIEQLDISALSENGRGTRRGCSERLRLGKFEEPIEQRLTDHYADILRKLREAGGLLADIFAQATPRFNNPVNLKRVIAMIDEEDWSAMDVDVKAQHSKACWRKPRAKERKALANTSRRAC